MKMHPESVCFNRNNEDHPGRLGVYEAPRVHRRLQDNGDPRAWRGPGFSPRQRGPHGTPGLCASTKCGMLSSAVRGRVHGEILRKSIKLACYTVHYLPVNRPRVPTQASLCFPEVHGNRPGRGAGSLEPPGSGFIIFLYHLAPDLVMMIQFVSKALCQVSREHEGATFLAFKTLEPGYGEIFSN